MELSFSKQAKLEALKNYKPAKSECCNRSFLQGYFFSRDIDYSKPELTVQSDVGKALATVKKLLSLFDIDSYIVTREKVDKKPSNSLYITEENSLQSLCELQQKNDICEKCMQSFLLGIFVADGILSDPSKEYQLEFVLGDNAKAQQLADCFEGLGFSFKVTPRRREMVVYTKQSETIEDFLATVGAQTMCLEIMSNKVVKDIRNKVNRITNCETANIAKASRASSGHMMAVQKLVSDGKFDLLEDDLKALAHLKMENPELSLSELGELVVPPMSKSSVNRRMQKLCQMAQIEDK
ncbi:MAG: DNA-binding protein WhiA [Oscillospiraceae bacterium]